MYNHQYPEVTHLTEYNPVFAVFSDANSNGVERAQLLIQFSFGHAELVKSTHLNETPVAVGGHNFYYRIVESVIFAFDVATPEGKPRNIISTY